ncbi:MAG: hypothetical protein LBM08_14850 [Dysgonamonadaceae bacterium]|nr:hypothetical protein [Dysgonamonadaceae bacterium]
MKILNYTIMTMLLLSAGVNIHAADNDSDKKTYKKTEIRAGIRMLSLDGLNDALSQNGLLKVNEMAYRFYIGERFIYRKVVINTGIEGLISSNDKDERKSALTSWGPSLEVGYKILETGKMELYPYTGLSWSFVSFGTSQRHEGTSFSAVYSQSLAERVFHHQELDMMLGLSYRLNTGCNGIGIRAAYHPRVFQSKWKHAGKEVDFPSTDMRGWEVSVSFDF